MEVSVNVVQKKDRQSRYCFCLSILLLFLRYTEALHFFIPLLTGSKTPLSEVSLYLVPVETAPDKSLSLILTAASFTNASNLV